MKMNNQLVKRTITLEKEEVEQIKETIEILNEIVSNSLEFDSDYEEYDVSLIIEGNNSKINLDENETLKVEEIANSLRNLIILLE